MNVTLSEYYKGFLSLYAVVAGIPFLPPILHLVIPDSDTFAQYLYPPLGDIERLAFAFTVIFLLLSSFAVFGCCRIAQRLRPSIPAVLIVGAALGVGALIGLYVSYVREIPIYSINLSVPVSIGYERTDFAIRTYPEWNDWAMLHDTGPQEEKIQLLWTQRSIWIVRGALWAAYTLTLACFLSIVSLMVYQHALEKNARL